MDKNPVGNRWCGGYGEITPDSEEEGMWYLDSEYSDCDNEKQGFILFANDEQKQEFERGLAASHNRKKGGMRYPEHEWEQRCYVHQLKWLAANKNPELRELEGMAKITSNVDSTWEWWEKRGKANSICGTLWKYSL